MAFRSQLVCMLFPGIVLFIIGGTLLDPVPGLALAVLGAGVLLLIGWPIFSIVVHLRHGAGEHRHAPGGTLAGSQRTEHPDEG
ncbi:MAG: hypothetical protein ACTIC1_08185 [Brevibacterium sp.]